MGKSPKSVRLGDSLSSCAELRWQGLGYRSFADYVKSLIRYDCLVGGEDHSVTKPITHLPLEEQDRTDGNILSWVEQGKKGRGVLLERMIERAIDAGAKTPEELKKKIGDEL